MRLQYELWQECNNFCDYCTLGHNIIKTPTELKIQALKITIEEIKNIDNVNSLGFIGGEFFQGQLKDVRDLFFKLIDLSNDLLKKDRVKELWINATMTLGDQKDLYEVINRVDNNKLWILTSYDIKGRFHNDKMLETWKYHMNKIHEEYPEVKLNTTSIITGEFIKRYLNDEFNIYEFENTYHTKLFLKTPVKPEDKMNESKAELNEELGYEFFPKRKDFLSFMLKFKEKEGIEAFDNLFSNELKAEDLHKNYNDDKLRNITFHRSKDFREELNCNKFINEISVLKCGHPKIYQCYVDVDNCVICDKIKLTSI